MVVDFCCLCEFCAWSMFCYAVLIVISSFAIILIWKRERERERGMERAVAFKLLLLPSSELIIKYNIDLKTIMQQGISELVLYGD